MGTLTSALAPIIQIGSALGTVANVIQPFYKDNISANQQKQSNDLALKQAQANAANQKELNRIAGLKEDTDRRNALRRAVAKQRANFGASGVGSADGSAEAVLLGMFSESDEERQLREQSLALRNNALDLNSAQIQQKNLLEQAQTQQKQNFARLTDIF